MVLIGVDLLFSSCSGDDDGDDDGDDGGDDDVMMLTALRWCGRSWRSFCLPFFALGTLTVCLGAQAVLMNDDGVFFWGGQP